MVTIRFTENIQRHVKCDPADVEGSTVREALDAYFAKNESARNYVLDDQGALRSHMTIFVNGRTIADRQSLSDDVHDGAFVDIMQALSGG